MKSRVHPRIENGPMRSAMSTRSVRIVRDGALRRFSNPLAVVRADAIPDVIPALEEVERHTGRGRIAVGFVAYEAASAFDRALQTHSLTDLPLVWFALYDAEREQPDISGERTAPVHWEPALDDAEYRRALGRIRDYIAAGDTYQVNYTYPLVARDVGDPVALFHEAFRNQPTEFAAYLDLGTRSIASVSPELFFCLDRDRIVSRPMKGTAPRGLWSADDTARGRALQASSKDRAENVMIVDMLRNDLGRIADTGSVEVDGLFEVERYPTLWQMTSTVRARTSAGVPEIFRALFPCASVTGAPKIRTMEIINELEAYPRGAYCGAIGWWGPGRRARFSVGIRTVTANRETGEAVYSVGSGITWDSLTDAEHDECRLKSKILTNSEPDFELIETIAWNDGYELFEEHLERLGASLRYFGFRGSLHPVRQRLADTARGLNGPTKVRVRVDRKGEVRIATHPLPKASVLRVGLATDPVDPNNRFLYHKTTNREMYEQARRTRPDLDDVILWNAAGEITETTIANVVVRFDGHWFTPPVASGLLPGVLRGALLREGEIAERVLHVADLDRAEEIRLINSVRGWMRIEWVPDRPASLARS